MESDDHMGWLGQEYNEQLCENMVQHTSAALYLSLCCILSLHCFSSACFLLSTCSDCPISKQTCNFHLPGFLPMLCFRPSSWYCGTKTTSLYRPAETLRRRFLVWRDLLGFLFTTWPGSGALLWFHFVHSCGYIFFILTLTKSFC